MLKRWIWIIPAIIVILSLSGCGSNSTQETPVVESPTTPTVTIPTMPVLPTFVPDTTLPSPQPGSIVGSPFLPGEVLVELPVYPGAVGTTFFDPGLGPPSFPVSMPGYGPKKPGYQSASAQSTVQAGQEDILGWYLAQLGAKGYRHSGEDGAGNATVISHSIPFFLPTRPLISVEVHVYNLYTSPDSSKTSIFELLVTYAVPLPKPTEESLPSDINSVQIEYAPGTTKEVVKTITGAQDVASLVSMVNDLPVRPDYIILGGPGLLSSQLFRLEFHSIAKGDITVTDVLGGIQMGDYPVLDDTHGLLKEAVEQMIGIPGASN